MAYKQFTDEEKSAFAEKQKQTIEEMRNTVRTVLDNFQSHPEQMAEAFAFGQQFYQYSLGNSLLIEKANPHAEYVASYEGWKKLGYSVIKGAKAIKILAPVIATFYKDGTDANGVPIYKRLSELPEEERAGIDKSRLMKRTVGYKPGNVFDISETTCPAEDYPKIFNMGYSSEMHKTVYEALKKAAEDIYNISVTEKDLESISLRGQYVPYGGGSIETNHLLNDTQKLDTFAHEFGHALMLKYYPEESEKNVSIREFEADTISLMLQSRFGIDVAHSQSRIDHLKEHYDKCIALGKEFNIKKFYEEVSKVYDKLIYDVQPVVDQFIATAVETKQEAEKQAEAEDHAAKAKSAVENQLDEQSKRERKAEHKAAVVTAAATAAAGTAVLSKEKICAALMEAGVDKSLADAAAQSARKILLQAQSATCILYQIADEKAAEFGKSLLALDKDGLGVRQKNYKAVYTAELAPGETLNTLYARLNLHVPEDFQARPVGISDIITVERGGEKQAYFLDTDGFQEVPEFLTKIPNRSLSERIDEVLSGKTERANDIYVCDTPKVLIEHVGMKQLPMFLSQNHLKKIVSEEGHNIRANQVKSLETLLKNPVMVMDSMTVPGSKVVVTSEKDKQDNPIVVAIKPDGHGYYELQQMSSNFLASMYGKDNFIALDKSGNISPDSFIGRAISQNKILYADKEKSHELIGDAALQLRGIFISHDSSLITSISENSKNVNTSENKSEPVPTEEAPLANKEKSHELIGEAALQLRGAFISHDSSLTTSISENPKNVNALEEKSEPVPIMEDKLTANVKAEPVPVNKAVQAAESNIAKAAEVPAPPPQPQEEQQNEVERKPQKQYGSQKNSNDKYEWRDQLVNNIDIRDVADRLGYTITHVGNKFSSLSEHDSVRFYPNNTYVRESVPKGAARRGGTTIDFVKNFDFDDGLGLHCADGTPVNEAKGAMKWLSENFNVQIAKKFNYAKVQAQAAPKKEFKLPEADNPNHVVTYLHKTRGIDGKTISSMLKRGLLYEEKNAFHNAIFVGVNKDGERDFANHHTTLPNSKFKGDIGGSNEETGWYVANGSDKLYVTEAPIDAMSLMSVKLMDGENPDDANYLATCSTAKLNILYNRLADDPNIKTIVFAMDKDDPGQKAIQTAVNTISKKFPDITCKQYELPDGCGKDVNDYLKYRNSHANEKSPNIPEPQNHSMAQEPISPEI